MSRVNRVAVWLVVVVVVAVAVGSVYANVVRYQEEITADEQRVVTHAQAMEMCEAAGLIYDYGLEGNTVEDYCIRPELWNAQQGGQND